MHTFWALLDISVQFSCSVVSNSLQPHGLQHAWLPCPSPTPGACSNSCPLSWWCHPAISSSVIPFSSCPQSLSASGSFPMSQFFPSGGQRIEASASTSVLPMNSQDWFPLGWTGWISLQSKGLSRVFSNTTVLKHQFFSAQLTVKKEGKTSVVRDTKVKNKPQPGRFYLYCCCCCCRSGAQSCPALCDSMDCSTPGLPVLHHLPEFAQTRVRSISDVNIQNKQTTTYLFY